MRGALEERTVGPVATLLHLPLNLPAVFVVRSIVEELAAVCRRAEKTTQKEFLGMHTF